MNNPVNHHQQLASSRFGFPASRRASVIASLLLVFAFHSTARASETMAEDAMDCLIEPWVVSDVGSPVQGVISKLLVDRGERVTRGQPLAQLESSVESAEVSLAQISAETESELAVREADLTLAKLELDRLEDLYRQKIISAQQRDEATARFRIARATLKQAQENRKIQQLELRRSERLYARRILTSPVDGVVVAQLAFAGEFVYDNPVMTVAALDPLRVEVMLPARLFGTIAVGDQAQLYPELGGDSALVASVDVVDAMLDSRSGTFGVRLKVPNSDYRIPAGQRCRIVFEPIVAAANPDRKAAPTEAAEQ